MAEMGESGQARVEGSIARAARVALAVAMGVGLLHLAAVAAVSTGRGEAWLRARVSSHLASHLGEVTVDAVEVDWRLRVSARGIHLPARSERFPAVDVAQARASLSLRSLVAGRLEPDAIALRGVRLSGPLVAGPLDLDATLARASRGALEADVALGGGGRAILRAAHATDGWAVRAQATGLRADHLPAALNGGAIRLAAGELSAELDAAVAPDLGRAEGRLGLRADAVFLTGSQVGPAAVGPLAGAVTAAVAWDGAARRLSIVDGTLDLLDRATLTFEGEVGAAPHHPFSLAVRAQSLDFGALVAALPAGLAPPPSAPRPPGTLDAHLELAGSLVAPSAWTVAARLDLARLREAGRRAPAALRHPFRHQPDAGDPGSAFVVGPANPDFVPIAELPEHVVRAVTTAEDAGFFAHAGFDFDELRNALAAGAEAGRLARGGSTITQQLAKNLFLSPERTLARKAREAVIAVALEASLPKRRLLEIYLNVAEWGPGLWGIGPAARHWFGKDARELTPKEAAFLASVIPSPVRYHAMFERGRASQAWEARVNGLLFRMTEQGALTDDELFEGLASPISFAGG
jgi:penicillin-binding protein 1A